MLRFKNKSVNKELCAESYVNILKALASDENTTKFADDFKDMSLWEDKPYNRSRAVKLLQIISVPSKHISKICTIFEKEVSIENRTVDAFYSYLVSKSQLQESIEVDNSSMKSSPIVADFIESMKTLAWNIATPQNAKRLWASAWIATALWTAVVWWNMILAPMDNTASAQEAWDQNEYVMSPEEYAKRMKWFLDVTEFFSQGENIVVFNPDGKNTIKVRELQRSMIMCNNDLDPTDMTQAVPESCQGTIDILNTTLDGQVDNVLEGLRAMQQDSNTVLQIRMIEEFQSLRESSQNEFIEIPESNNTGKMIWAMSLILLSLYLLHALSQWRRRLRKDLSASENIDEARAIDDRFRPTLTNISALLGKLRKQKPKSKSQEISDAMDPNANFFKNGWYAPGAKKVEWWTLDNSDWDWLDIHPDSKK